MTTFNLASSPSVIPAGLQKIFAGSLRRLGSTGDAIQSAINAAAADYGYEGNSDMAAWWGLYADKGRIGGVKLQWLYTQREALTDLERRLIGNADWTEEGVSQSDSDVFDSVLKMRDQIGDDITLLESQVRGSRVPAVGVLTATSPPCGPVIWRDPNSPLYRGDPCVRRGPFGW